MGHLGSLLEHRRQVACEHSTRLATVQRRARAIRTADGHACDQVGLVMPTSLCSGQVARLIADELNAARDERSPVSRYVALAHTEGCGSANSAHLFLQTMLGHLRHPFTRRAVLLEHGCEQVHNDAVRAMSYPPDSHKDELPDAETLKERQREEQELVAELAEEEEEMGDGF